MSKQYPGGIISKTAPVPTGPLETGTAPGIWTLDQQAAYAKQGIWPTAGNVPLYIEDVFSTYIYTGNGTAQTITNEINLSGKGGMLWIKVRNEAFANRIVDSQRTPFNTLNSASTSAEEAALLTNVSAFNSNGFTLANSVGVNGSGYNYASWTFREQPKFFDVVTWSGNSVSGRLIPQSLGSAPGCIIVKCTNLAGTNWAVWHRSLATGYTLQLQGTNAAFNTKPQWFNSSTQGSSTTFEVGNDTDTNETGNTYVAYLFAHNAGGFGLTGTDNVISCGSFTTDAGSNATVNLGYEPQWILVKETSSSGAWYMVDNMRGLVGDPTSSTVLTYLRANTSAAEVVDSGGIGITSTGFQTRSGSIIAGNATMIYIAIRRGPMKTPTVGTSVYNAIARTGTSANATLNTVGFPPDLAHIQARDVIMTSNFQDRLRGPGANLRSEVTTQEQFDGSSVTSFGQNGVTLGADGVPGWFNRSPYTYINHFFRRAPSFFDEVCYTGTGNEFSDYNHNLGVLPELIFVKRRDSTGNWAAAIKIGSNFLTSEGAGGFVLNSTASTTSTVPDYNFTSTTARFGLVGNGWESTGVLAATYVAYLFATCPGVSKVGSYTGTGALQTVNCGFTTGTRFVLIKRTDSTGGWFTYDSTRGITSGNDPYLLMNSSAAEVTGTNYVDTTGVGFQVTAAAPAELNASGGTYIFLAIA